MANMTNDSEETWEVEEHQKDQGELGGSAPQVAGQEGRDMMGMSGKLGGRNQASEAEVTSPDIVMEDAQYGKRKQGGEDQGDAQKGEWGEDLGDNTPGEKATGVRETVA